MNKEEWKLSFLQFARENPSTIANLMLRINVGEKERKAIYLDTKLYSNTPLELLVQISKQSSTDVVPKFDIQFRDKSMIDDETGRAIKGELGIHNQLQRMYHENIMVRDGRILFQLLMTEISSMDGDSVFRESTTILFEASYNLEHMFYDIKNLKRIKERGRGRSRYLQDYYIDFSFSNDEYLEFFKELWKWGIRNSFSEKEMKQIQTFCEFCKFVKSTKSESKMVRIFTYLQENPLPSPNQ